MRTPCLENFTSAQLAIRQDGDVKRAWFQIVSIWLMVLVLTCVVTIGAEPSQALAWYGAILSGAIASVCLIRLVKASPTGIVKELVYVAGGSYLMLALASLYLFLWRF
jgi:hypothetical protein